MKRIPNVRPAHASEAPPLYDPAFEHDGCGTGFVARIDGDRTHDVVALAVRAVGNLTHRGAVSADAASGDGAGVTLQIPYELLAEDACTFGLEECDLRRSPETPCSTEPRAETSSSRGEQASASQCATRVAAPWSKGWEITAAST